MNPPRTLSEPGEPPPGDRPAAAGNHWLVYDGQCPFCRASLRLLMKMDWLRRLRPIDLHTQAAQLALRAPELTHPQLMEAMRLITPRRKVHAGFFALRRAAWLLPPLWPVAPLLYVPGISKLGPAIYRWIAQHRYGLARCTPGDACRF